MIALLMIIQIVRNVLNSFSEHTDDQTCIKQSVILFIIIIFVDNSNFFVSIIKIDFNSCLFLSIINTVFSWIMWNLFLLVFLWESSISIFLFLLIISSRCNILFSSSQWSLRRLSTSFISMSENYTNYLIISYQIRKHNSSQNSESYYANNWKFKSISLLQIIWKLIIRLNMLMLSWNTISEFSLTIFKMIECNDFLMLNLQSTT